LGTLTRAYHGVPSAVSRAQQGFEACAPIYIQHFVVGCGDKSCQSVTEGGNRVSCQSGSPFPRTPLRPVIHANGFEKRLRRAGRHDTRARSVLPSALPLLPFRTDKPRDRAGKQRPFGLSTQDECRYRYRCTKLQHCAALRSWRACWV
jgi:hypothetical protein